MEPGMVNCTLDDARMLSCTQAHDDLARGLTMPEHYGRNLDALRDCLGDICAPGRGFPHRASRTSCFQNIGR